MTREEISPLTCFSMLISMFAWPDVVQSPRGCCTHCLAQRGAQGCRTWQELPPLLQSEVPPHPHTPGVVTITRCAWCHQTEGKHHVFLTWTFYYTGFGELSQTIFSSVHSSKGCGERSGHKVLDIKSFSCTGTIVSSSLGLRNLSLHVAMPCCAFSSPSNFLGHR